MTIELPVGGAARINFLEPVTVVQRGETVETPTRTSFAVPIDDLLVARAKSGEEAALEQLFRRFEVPVYTLARRLTRSAHDAEDVLQETFLEVVRSIGRFRGDGSLAGWIRKVAASKALMKLRQSGARALEEELSEERLETRPTGLTDGSAAGAAATARVDVETAVGRLSDAARAVLWLHDVEGYSHEEIAALAGKTPSFSKSQLARAHARLRELLAPGVREGSCT